MDRDRSFQYLHATNDYASEQATLLFEKTFRKTVMTLDADNNQTVPMDRGAQSYQYEERIFPSEGDGYVPAIDSCREGLEPEFFKINTTSNISTIAHSVSLEIVN